jgi:phosphoribosylglycinamide formyltransferase-1
VNASSAPSDSSLRPPLRYAVLASGGGSNFQAILDHFKGIMDPAFIGNNPTQVVFVASNNSGAGVLARARDFGVPVVEHVSAKKLGSEEAAVQRLLDLIDEHKPDLLVLAGYMKKVPNAILKRMKNRVINIHPALLPKYGGAGMYGHHVHEAVVSAGETFSGMTIHMVNENYDEGQVILQRRTDDINTPDPSRFAQFVLQREHDSYWRVLRGFATREIVPTDSDDPSQAVQISDAWKREMRNLSGTIFP